MAENRRQSPRRPRSGQEQEEGLLLLVKRRMQIRMGVGANSFIGQGQEVEEIEVGFYFLALK